MHIPDGFLTTETWVSAWVLSVGGISYCIRKTTYLLNDRLVPLMGVMSAFIFAAQMLNFPVIGGTSGHLMGGLLASILVGPYAGAIVIAVVLTAQCFIFQDGGLTALGANILNMSLLGTVGGFVFYHTVRKVIGGNRGVILGAGVAAWVSVVLASSAVAVELAISGISPLRVVLPAMAGIHVFIGIGEAIITCLILSFVLKVRPDLIYTNPKEEAP